MQVVGLEQPAICGDFVAPFQGHHVADHDLVLGETEYCPIAKYLDAQRLLVSVQHLEFAIAFVLAQKGDACGKDYGNHDRQSLDRGMTRCQADEEERDCRDEQERRDPLSTSQC